jgi:hypothetical protein
MKKALLLLVATALLLSVPAQAATSTVGDASNGKALTIHTGDTVTVVLANTYWTIDTGAGTVLKAVGAQANAAGHPGPGCYGGSGCGTATRTFAAVAAGTANLTAHRTTCGEALQCSADQKSFRVSVTVLGKTPTKLPFTGDRVGWAAAAGLLLLGLGAGALLLGRRQAWKR